MHQKVCAFYLKNVKQNSNIKNRQKEVGECMDISISQISGFDASIGHRYKNIEKCKAVQTQSQNQFSTLYVQDIENQPRK